VNDRLLADQVSEDGKTQRDALTGLLRKIDCLVLNESEAREFTKQTSLIKAGRLLLNTGPKYVVIKKGEHGCLLFGNDFFFSAPAYPLEDIHDPTGAGDCFAGAFTGYLARANRIDHESLRKAVIYGSVIASYCVEDFSLTRLESLTEPQINERHGLFKSMSHFDAV